MTRPRISCEFLYEKVVPCCPHCRGTSIGEARISVEALLDAWDDIAEHVPVDGDGFAWMRGLTIDCPDCRHPVVIRIGWPKVAFIAARTDADRRVLEGAST